MAFSLVTGPGVQCYINDILVGEVRAIKWSSQTPKRELRGIDSSEPLELAPSITRLAGSITMYRKVGLGGLEGMGVVSNFENAVKELYVGIRIVQRATDTVLFQCDNAVITGQEWDVAARQIMTGVMTFEGITWHNEVNLH